jgi:hypothetical protein
VECVVRQLCSCRSQFPPWLGQVSMALLLSSSFIQNGGSPITMQRAFCIHFALGRRDPVLDKKFSIHFGKTSSASKRKSTGRPRTATGLETVAVVKASCVLC